MLNTLHTLCIESLENKQLLQLQISLAWTGHGWVNANNHPIQGCYSQGKIRGKELFCIKWHETYQLAFKCSTSTRLLEFQYKILHRRIATNEFLCKIGLKDDSNCSFCKDEPEKLSHLFWSYPKVTAFWTFLIQHFISSQIIPENYQFNLLMALGLMPDSSNFSLFLARHYIWICKNNKTLPKVEGFSRYLKSIHLFQQKAAGTLQTKWAENFNLESPSFFSSLFYFHKSLDQ